VKIGGWVDNIFGEDGEISSRMARFGYRAEVEQRSLVYSELPESLIGLLQQRSRWSVAFYHSRGRNLKHVIEFRSPRSLVFLWNLLSHGVSLGHSLTWTYLAASIMSGALDVPGGIPFYLIVKIASIQLLIYVVQIVLYSYNLNKIKSISDIRYFPVTRIIPLILTVFVKPQVMEVILSWSSRWSKYSTDSFKDLRREVKRSVDPMYPEGELRSSRINTQV
jgi:cellulose synthase/poly-beta-1,6-N-acetylglucosamine synthase-like glycosyltransferase